MFDTGREVAISSSKSKQSGAENFLLDSGAQLPECPIQYPGQRIPMPDPGLHTASGARVQHDGGRRLRTKHLEARTIRALYLACDVQKTIISLDSLAQHGYCSDLRADTGTLFFPDRIRTQPSHHKEDSLFFVKGMLMAPLVTAGVSDDVVQEIQMPIDPQALEDVEEPMLYRPVTLKDPGNS